LKYKILDLAYFVLRFNHFLLGLAAFQPLPQRVDESDEPEGYAYPAQNKPNNVIKEVVGNLEAYKRNEC